MYRRPVRLITLILALAATVLVAVPASLAQQGMSVDPDSGPPGTQVRLQGCFSPELQPQTVTFYWDSTNGQVLGSDQLNSDFCFDSQVNVPSDATTGTHTIVARSDQGGELTGTFDVTQPAPSRSLSLDPSTATPGDDVDADGCDYGGGATVTLTWGDGSNLGTATADSAGCFSTTFAVPGGAVAGDHTVTANDGGGSATDTLAVADPDVSLEPSTGVAGDPFDVVTCGWPSGTQVDVLWDLQDPLATGLAIGQSGCAATTVTVPAGAGSGTHPVLVTDGSGPAPTATFQVQAPVTTLPTITLDPPPTVQWSYADFYPAGVEVTQAIQCFDTSEGLSGCADNSMPLATGRSTAVRIYLGLDGPTRFDRMDGVPVRFNYRLNGGTWRDVDLTGPALRDIDRLDPDASANVFMTVGGSDTVDLDYYVEVDPDGTSSDFTPVNNRLPASGVHSVTFERRAGLDIRGRLLDVDGSTPSEPSGWAVDGGGAQWLEQILPTATGGIDYANASGRIDWSGSLGYNPQHDLIKQLNGEYALARIFALLFDVDFGLDHLYGWWPGETQGGGHADMPSKPHAGGLGITGVGEDTPGSSPGADNPNAGALIFGHEIVHLYDVLHTNTRDSCGSTDPGSTFPYSSSSIQEVGFNPVTRTTYDPASTHDVMSYCPSGGSSGGWIAPFTWNLMFSNLAPGARDTFARSSRRAQQVDGQGLFVDATLLRDGGGSIGAAYLGDGGVDVPTTPGDDARVELRDGDGATLESSSFAVDFTSEYHRDGYGAEDYPDVYDRVDVQVRLDWDDAASEVVLLDDTGVLDRRTVTANDPTVTFTDPSGAESWTAGTTETIAWDASDPDGDALRFTLLYSNDGGGTWQTLETGLTATSHDVDVDTLAGGADARFRVVATDGVRTDTDTSASVAVPGHAPAATLLHPTDGLRIQQGDLLVLSGGGQDLEDGRLPGGSLDWASDRAGDLGTGDQVAVSDLAPGPHTITLTATDSDGLTATASADIVVAAAGAVQVAPASVAAGDDARVGAELTAGGPATRCEIDHGDGSAAVRGELDGTTCIGPVHTWFDPGTYRVAVRFLDGDGEIAESVTTQQVAAGEVPGVRRLAGTDRYATAAAASAERYDRGVPVVYVATGSGFADALSGVPAAGRAGGPVLLTRHDALPAPTEAELARLAPDRIVVLGGTAVISDAVAQRLADFTPGGVSRLAGSDRYITSAAVSAASFDPGVDVAYVATGQDFADALAGGPAGALTAGPVLLTRHDSIPAAVRDELERLQPGRIHVLGGSAAVSDGVVGALATLTDGDVSRLAGPDRFATAADVSAATFGDATHPVVYVATGQDFADALAGGALAGPLPGPVLLVGGDIPQSVRAELDRLQPRRIVVLGGSAAVADEVVGALSAYRWDG